MKNLSIKILVLLAGLAGGVSASDLPDCPTDRSAVGTTALAPTHVRWRQVRW